MRLNLATVLLATTVLTICALAPAESPRRRERSNPRDRLTYLWIRPGSYFTGCDPSDRECIGWERPRRRVTINRGFWIGKTEVTQAAFVRILGFNPSRYRSSSLLPVEQVDWKSAESYCSKVGMRLPSESEWEFAAAGGLSTPRYGSLDSIAWYDGNSRDTTHDVGRKEPNAYGLYDMLGNVWEWVADRSSSDPHRGIMKGGSFYNIARDLRVPNRETPLLDIRHRNIGFRCVSDKPLPLRTEN